MTKSITVSKYNDPGHGWYALPLKVVQKLGLDLSMYPKVTCNRKATVLFFEEDCEFNPIKEQLKNRGIDLKVKSFHGNKQSKVRNYPVVTLEYFKSFTGWK